MTTLVLSTTLREIRCPGEDELGRTCGKLILKYRPGSMAVLDLSCPRCKTHFTIVVESTG